MSKKENCIASPIARALISKEVGDSVEVNTPGGGKSYEILINLFDILSEHTE